MKEMTGADVKRIRETSKLTQAAFAQRVGVSRQYISHIEIGRRDVLEHIEWKIRKKFKIRYAGGEDE